MTGPILIVLWIFVAHPWHFGPLPQPPGWASLATFQDRASCEYARGNLAYLAPGNPTVCLPPDIRPLVGEERR